MNMALIFRTLVLLAVANGTPVIVKRVFGARADHAIDCGVRLADGRFMFGPSKTMRGVISSVIATALIAAAVGLTVYAGAVIALGAMAGDLASSFVKRRLGLEPSSKATGLDQIPEALLPCLLLSAILPLTAGDIAVIVLLFFGGEVVLSELLFRAGVRDRPY
ncbi:MAG TPA: CDP-archaeol synthase [Rhizomicrobium sp.]|jgi:CDP-2,3-bis-(O-geranylgeranyl)-sn-glycerol synthase